MEDTWNPRDLLILAVVAEGEAEGVRDVNTEWIQDRTNLTGDQIVAGLDALIDGRYVSATEASTMAATYYMSVKLRERGRRTVGTWPSEDSYAALVNAVEAAAQDAPDEETRSRLVRLREGLLGVSRDVGVAVLTAWTKGQVGL